MQPSLDVITHVQTIYNKFLAIPDQETAMQFYALHRTEIDMAINLRFDSNLHIIEELLLFLRY